ncbi:MAG: AFG1 family ATPase [Zoogloeaceae bacterium]|jgi:cell division protein ZapE|nr:AFG1 family ATPase [Zoogloeaceae bacterium]
MGTAARALAEGRRQEAGAHAMLRALESQFQSRRIVPDSAQRAAAGRLQRLYDDLVAFKHKRRSKLRKLIINPPLPRGIYLWGGVGRGKSLLMDCFFETVPYQRKRRVHFHAFMREVHERLRELHALKAEADPLLEVARCIARETRLMCFDEFHVSDIADAMILGRLMEALFERGVVFCLTSNYPPDGLYPNGLQRQNFLPAIELLKERLDVLEVDGGIDYRLRALEKAEVYIVPTDASGEAKMDAAFRAIAGGEGHRRPLGILGRRLPVCRRAIGVIWFDFQTLCAGPRSQNDYLEIARAYHTVFLSGVPRMTEKMANEARRFTWLIDIFYDHKVKLVLTAACEAGDLFREGIHAVEFQRTVSRLIEMRTRDYLSAPHHGAD